MVFANECRPEFLLFSAMPLPFMTVRLRMNMQSMFVLVLLSMKLWTLLPVMSV